MMFGGFRLRRWVFGLVDFGYFGLLISSWFVGDLLFWV